MKFVRHTSHPYQNPVGINGRSIPSLFDPRFWEIMNARRRWRDNPVWVLIDLIMIRIDKKDFTLLAKSDPELFWMHTLITWVRDRTWEIVSWEDPIPRQKRKKKVGTISQQLPDRWDKEDWSRWWRLQRNRLREEAFLYLEKLENKPPLS